MAEVKSLPQHIKAIDGRTVTTLFSVAGNVDHGSDRVIGGAFAKTIAERGTKILHLWNHNYNEPPIAVVKSLREIARAELPAEVQSAYPDATGGAEAVSEYIDSPQANSVLAAIKAGAPMEASFGYDVIQADFTNEEKGATKTRIRNIKELRLHELSTVVFGANSATVASKALATPTASKVRATLQRIKGLAEGDMDIWSEAYDIYGAAGALSSIGMLLSEECDDPQAMAQLLGAMRLLLAFIAGEIDGIDTMVATGGASDMAMQTAGRLLTTGQMLIKAGARNASADLGMLNDAHDLLVKLGATNCAVPDSGAKSRAVDHAPTLTQLRTKLAYFDLIAKDDSA